MNHNVRKQISAPVPRFFRGDRCETGFLNALRERNALWFLKEPFVPVFNKCGRFAGFYAMIRKNPPAPAGGGSQKDRKAAHVPNSKSIES